MPGEAAAEGTEHRSCPASSLSPSMFMGNSEGGVRPTEALRGAFLCCITDARWVKIWSVVHTRRRAQRM